jgi:hypothetical protein
MMDAPAHRELLARAIWGATGACAAGIVGASASPSIAAAATWRTIARDVAYLLNTFTPIDAEGSTFFVDWTCRERQPTASAA